MNSLSKKCRPCKTDFSQIPQLSQSRFSNGYLCLGGLYFSKAVLESKQSRSLCLTEKNITLAVLQSVEFTTRHTF